jgi:uncharacterized membrane protein
MREKKVYMRDNSGMSKYIFLFIAISFLFPSFASAQEVVQDVHETLKAKVVEIVSEKIEIIPGTDTKQFIQELRVQILSGARTGKIVPLTNDYSKLEKGDGLYVTHIIPWDGGSEVYAMSEPYRLPALMWLGIFFVLAVIVFGGKQGLRGLLSLLASLAFIALFLLPGIMHGYSPVLVSIGVASLIIILGSYVTHGFNKTTSAAVIGMIITVALVGLLAHLSIGWTDLSGFGNDEATYLNFNSDGKINLLGLLLGGILIGLLGVMYDAAIGQSISVEELHRVAPHMPRKAIYARALRIGREHIGALVNTLAIAYVGASLPLLLLFYGSAESASIMINREIFATEIVRSLVGSIGLILTVPITTLISVWMIVKNTDDSDPVTIAKEKEALKHVGHTH